MRGEYALSKIFGRFAFALIIANTVCLSAAATFILMFSATGITSCTEEFVIAMDIYYTLAAAVILTDFFTVIICLSKFIKKRQKSK